MSLSTHPSPEGPERLALSIVLPCFRAAAVAHRSVARLQHELAGHTDDWEVWVVDDGGGDFEAGDPWPEEPRAQLLRLDRNRGKGAAVQAGMARAQGRVRVFTDVDLPYGVEALLLAARYVERHGFDLVIGDRTLPGASYLDELPLARRLSSQVFTTIVGRLVTGGFFDTQCGLKAFEAQVAEEIFTRSRVERFAFDVELIYMTLIHRLDIKRIPVRLERDAEQQPSTVRLGRDAPRMLLDLLRMKWRRSAGAYRSRALEERIARRVERELDELRRTRRDS